MCSSIEEKNKRIQKRRSIEEDAENIKSLLKGQKEEQKTPGFDKHMKDLLSLGVGFSYTNEYSKYFSSMFKLINKGTCIDCVKKNLNNILEEIEKNKELKFEFSAVSSNYSFFGDFQKMVGKDDFLNNLGEEMSSRLAKLFKERLQINVEYLQDFSFRRYICKNFLENVLNKKVSVELKSSLLTPIVRMMIPLPLQKDLKLKGSWCNCYSCPTIYKLMEVNFEKVFSVFKEYFCDEKKGLFGFEHYSEESLVSLVNICKIYLTYCRECFDVDFEAKTVNNDDNLYDFYIDPYHKFLLKILGLCSQRVFSPDYRKELKDHLVELFENGIVTPEQAEEALNLKLKDGLLDLKERTEFLVSSLLENQQNEGQVPAIDRNFYVHLGGTTNLPIGLFVHL